MLRTICPRLDSVLSFADIQTYSNNDYLQIAEYLYLKNDRSVGPLRHEMSHLLSLPASPALSGAHIDLLNLGAPQIYTTNFDDAIEDTFRAVNEPVAVVALPKHVATINPQKTQVVKYHGDLRHEQTLVLTESSYYSRLDFESPMDLKFRSDILGKSVLFMGYSFSDINIRIIWFKLIRMMKDIRPEDRPQSYILTLRPNPVRQVLYDEVGISTIVLDPDESANTPSEMSELLGSFLVIDYRRHAILKCWLGLLAGISSYSRYGRDERWNERRRCGGRGPADVRRVAR